MAMKVQKQQLVEVLLALGVNSARKHDEDKLQKDLKSIDDLVDDDTWETLTKEQTKLVKAVQAANKDDEEFVIVDKPKSVVASSNGKKPKAEVVEDEGEEVEVEDASEDDSEEEVTKPKKGGKGGGVAVQKKPVKKPVKAKAVKKDSGPSNKEVVYKAWLKGKGKKTQPDYLALVNGAVKDTTIKGWISAWGRGENLPACAKVKA